MSKPIVLLTLLALFNSVCIANANCHETVPDTTDSASRLLFAGEKVGYRILNEKGLTVAVWYPSQAKEKDYVYKIGPNKVLSKLAYDAPFTSEADCPVVIYSHGAVGSGLSSFFLCEALARKGYAVFAPDFNDKFFASRIDKAVPASEEKLKRIWDYIYSLRDHGLNDQAKSGRKRFAYRPKKLLKTIALVKRLNNKEGSDFYQKLETEKIGLLGHSFGAWTSLMVAGAEPRFSKAKVSALVSLSGPVNKNVFSVVSKNDLALIHCPIMFQFGDKEKLFANRQDDKLLYQKANAPKYLASIASCNHFTFSCGAAKKYSIASDYLSKSEPRRAISELTIAFFNHYMKSEPKAELLTKAGPGVDFIKSQSK